MLVLPVTLIYRYLKYWTFEVATVWFSDDEVISTMISLYEYIGKSGVYVVIIYRGVITFTQVNYPIYGICYGPDACMRISSFYEIFQLFKQRKHVFQVSLRHQNAAVILLIDVI